MLWTVLFQRATRLASAPAGAAATATATSVFLGENGSARASSNVVSNAVKSNGLIAARGRLAEAAVSINAGRGGSWMAWYESHLQSRPVATKMATGSVLWGLGDFVAQVVPELIDGGEKAPNGNSTTVVVKSTNVESLRHFTYDYARTARAAFYGFAIHAPASHVHFNFLEWMTLRANVTGLGIPVFKAFMEQFVYWSWLSNGMYHGAMGAMQGQGPTEIYDRLVDVLWETQKAQWIFWIPIQLLNFRFVPVRHQLNVVLITSVAWTALLSAWYPPKEDDKEVKVVKEFAEAAEQEKLNCGAVLLTPKETRNKVP